MSKETKDILKWAGGELDFSCGCVVMGILNVTPDSFSDGGDFFDTCQAANQAVMMVAGGAGIIDIGAESTRPGSDRVDVRTQIGRAVPVIEKIAGRVNVPISIDTRDYEVAAAALDAGASIINDVTALSDDRMARLAAKKQVPVVLMHMRGEPKTMQAEPKYDDVVTEVRDYLIEKAQRAENFGVKREMIFIDPGIGFGKTCEHNIELLKNIYAFVETGYKILLGTSRKKFIGQIIGKDKPKERIFGTAATVAAAVFAGVSIVRVHDVSQMVDIVKVASKIKAI